MSFPRKHPNAGIRCPGHDYRSRCIYHIVLNKAEGFPLFSEVKGIPGDRQWPPKVEVTEIGRIIGDAISSLKSAFPFTSILRRCIMPDHVHFAIFIKEETDIHLGTIIASLKKVCSGIYETLGNPPEIEFFIPGYHDTFLTGKDQLKKMLSYISDNPRRYLVRKSNPGWFRQFIICSPDGKNRYDAYGNWDLLSEFQRVPVKVSRKYSPSELKAWKKRWHTTILNDGVLVSPFINPNEKKVRDWAIDNGGSLIYLTYRPFPEKFKPQGKMFDLCAEGRLLIIYIPPDEKEAEYIRNNACPSYSHCQRMNSIAKEIAEIDYQHL
ncbi:MAG: hypothetical protein K2N05_06345 [Muribaculaceae bacterium]|nr:hypothetical protein [Muribaculaceae bacterium]